ncbi:hypothetical protein [uncultured Pseudoteredinibacter sp.]|uniref:VPS10 domain-containing protein n=1 Tax=uncultured Pseudoteredinibacter sp. TaxID=1641701 RepID=UPI002606E49D|nr:hypothetical protein [uncultured Pseudoteredinibacter sp.]
MRNLTPAKTGGRIVDVAFHPTNRNIRLVAAASGGIWKTENAGTTWKSVFDNQAVFSMATVIFDPKNPNIVWAGSGENNAQRSVGMGDGVYKSHDGGNSWQNVGLKTSEHIGKIVIHPENSDIIYVASQGGLWKAGGERGLYKTVDGGKNWQRILHISENTGISDVIVDPRNPDIIIATSYQRRRHFGILVAGGPEGGAFRSTDGGNSWNKIKSGFPQGDLGRIGLARSPQQPDVLYSIVAGTEKTKGIYRSSNNGLNWKKMNDYMVVDAQYYMEIFPDPHQFDKIYIVDVFTKVSEDGGKTLKPINQQAMHVDNHEVEFDPNDPNYLLIAGDGGIYESWDKGEHWRFIDNLPLTQFYRVGLDNDFPFYNVYGGTQDNNTLGGPSQTRHRKGIRNSDWFITKMGDGFQVRVDPSNPDLLYTMSQYAGIVRYDKKSGEQKDIKPIPKAGEAPYRWAWDAPLVLSAHDNKTLYFAANYLFKSEDQGNTWSIISDDLSRKLDRNSMKVMGQHWGIDAIFKNVWTAPFGTVVSLSESPLKQGLIYAGTDDGLIQVTEDDGQSWRKIEKIKNVPKLAYLADLMASPHDENTVFAVFNHHKYGDYQPYIFKSSNKGKSWTNIASNLPKTDFAWTVIQDPKEESLLFAGTEYGLYFSVNGGKQWTQMRSGLPTIAIRDLEIQPREDDLVAASFGRGFYILDDMSFLRSISKKALNKDSLLFPVKNAWTYIIDNPDGYAYGANFFSSPNPDFGAAFTYYIKDIPETISAKRQQAEQLKKKQGEAIPYPDWQDFAREKREEAAKVVFVIKDENNKQIATINKPMTRGVSRVTWDLRHGSKGERGPLVAPGRYTVSMAKIVGGKWQDLGQSQSFEVNRLSNTVLPAKQPQALLNFQLQVMTLDKSIKQAEGILSSNLNTLKANADQLLNRSTSADIINSAEDLRQAMMDLQIQLRGNPLIVQKMELAAPSIKSRVSRIKWDFRNASSDASNTHKESFAIAQREFAQWIKGYNHIAQQIDTLNVSLHDLGLQGLKSQKLP